MKLIIVSGTLYVIGNIIQSLVDIPQLYWIPLAIFLFSLIRNARKQITEKKFNYYAINWLYVLSMGNIIKQVFYNESGGQLNDYWFGAIVTLIYLFKYITWNKTHGMKSSYS